MLLITAMVLLGAGLGLFTPANNRSTMASTPSDKLGIMGGLLNMMRSLGLIFGIDISGMLFISVANAASGGVAAKRATSSAVAFLSSAGLHGRLPRRHDHTRRRRPCLYDLLLLSPG